MADKNSKKGIPGWGWALIVILIIVLIIIILAVIGVIVGGNIFRDTVGNGVGGTCTGVGINSTCANGLVCNSGLCALPPTVCPKPNEPMNLDFDNTLDGLTWTVNVTWDAVEHADLYLLFVGETSTFDPLTESVFTTVVNTNSHTFEEVPPSSTVYVKVVGISEDCGIDNTTISDVLEITTGPIL